MPEEVDLSWAYELAAHSAEVSDANGLVGSCDHAPLVESEDVGGRGGEDNGMSEQVEKAQDFTNEPKLDELADSAQSPASIEVATDFDREPGLDNVARKGRDVDGEQEGRRAEGGEDGGRRTEN